MHQNEDIIAIKVRIWTFLLLSLGSVSICYPLKLATCRRTILSKQSMDFAKINIITKFLRDLTGSSFRNIPASRPAIGAAHLSGF